MAGLLLILAHPDDETFFAGGTIAKYAALSIPIGLVCATRGEHGATADLCSLDELPAVREAELRDAAGILGIRDLDVLRYEDQKLWAAPIEAIRRQIVAAVRRQRPQVVMTFDPHGANQHTDHIAIGRFAMDAVSAAADARWYPETGEAHNVQRLLWPSPISPFDLGHVAEVGHQPGVDILIRIAPFHGKKESALRAHRTQFPGLVTIFNRDGALSWEAFRIAWGQRPDSVPVDDLFANLS